MKNCIFLNPSGPGDLELCISEYPPAPHPPPAPPSRAPPPSSSSLLPGDIPYEELHISEPIGTGRFGTVYK